MQVSLRQRFVMEVESKDLCTTWYAKHPHNASKCVHEHYATCHDSHAGAQLSHPSRPQYWHGHWVQYKNWDWTQDLLVHIITMFLIHPLGGGDRCISFIVRALDKKKRTLWGRSKNAHWNKIVTQAGLRTTSEAQQQLEETCVWIETWSWLSITSSLNVCDWTLYRKAPQQRPILREKAFEWKITLSLVNSSEVSDAASNPSQDVGLQLDTNNDSGLPAQLEFSDVVQLIGRWK